MTRPSCIWVAMPVDRVILKWYSCGVDGHVITTICYHIFLGMGIYSYFEKGCRKKVHATIPKGIVGGFQFTVLQRNLKELARKAKKMCLQVLTESNKSRFDSYSRQEHCIDHIPYYLSGLSRAHLFRQPFSR